MKVGKTLKCPICDLEVSEESAIIVPHEMQPFRNEKIEGGLRCMMALCIHPHCLRKRISETEDSLMTKVIYNQFKIRSDLIKKRCVNEESLQDTYEYFAEKSRKIIDNEKIFNQH